MGRSKGATNAERVKAHKERLKEDPEKFTEFKKRRAEQARKARQRKKLQMTETELEQLRVYERDRKRKQRESKPIPMKIKLPKGL